DADAELEELAAEALRAPARIAGGHLSDKRRTRGRGSTRRPRASAPEGATACLVPAEDCRRLDEQRGVAPRRRHACCEPHREALPRCPPDPPRDLSLRDDELLPKQGVLGDETGAAAHDVGGQPHHEPKDLDHAARCTAVSVRMAFVARTRCEVQLAYVIGVARPVSVAVECFGTETVPVEQLQTAISMVFDLRPAAIIAQLNLRRAIYQQTAAYGHFGRTDIDLPWEQTDKVEALKEAVKTASSTTSSAAPT